MNNLKKSIRQRLALFVFTAIIIFLTVFILIRGRVFVQTDEAFLISGSEKQRMLSQNITKLAFVIRDVVDTPQRKDAIVNLSQLSSEIKSSHNSLYKLHRVSIKNKSLDSLYKLSEVYLNRITTASNNIINSSENDTIIDDVYAIANAELPYLWAMDAIVDQYQQMAESNLRSVEFDLYMFFVISILLFTSGLFYIFMPAVKKLAKKDRDLRRNKEELGISKQKIKKNLIEVRKLQSDIESKDRYNRIFIEQAPSSIAMLDKNMRYIAVSEKWKTDYKMVGKDIVGRSHYDLFPEIGEEWKKQHQKCLNGEIDICDQYPFKRADGSVQWIFWDVRPWYNANEEIGGLIMYTGDITHIKEQSQAKEKVENILESTNKVAKIGTWELDLSTDKYELSDITRKILELPKDYEVYGKESLKFYKEGESRNKITECLNHLITTGEPFDIEVEFKTYKGNSKWIRDIGQAEFIAGKCVRIFGIYQDITHIKESENSLIRQNQILNFAEEITMMGNWRWEVTDDVITWSKNLYHIFGLDESKTDLSYETYFNFVHPDDKDKVTNYREKSIEEKKFHENFIHKIITSDGKIKTVHLLGEVITNNDGEVIELIGTCQDITHQRIAEIKFRGLLESAPDAMVIVDEEAKIHLINKQAERIFGYSPSEILGKPVEVLVPNHILENFITYRKRFFNNPKAVTMGENKEFVGVNKNGEEFPAQISLSPLETEDGLLVSAAIRDISIEKQAAQKIINANENLELLAKKLTAQNTQLADFAHITSHNLRAPVSNLHSLLDLYQVSEEESDKETVFLKFEKVINHLTETLNTLVEALKVKNEIVHREEVSFSSTLKKTKELLAAQIIESGVLITKDFKEIDKISYNKIYFESIFLNLVENAIKFRSVKRDPKIHLESILNDGRVQLKITDNGLGINLARHKHKLFGLNKVFHRHKEARGVGLFMTKLHIEALGGSISVTSVVDEGSTFIINFN